MSRVGASCIEIYVEESIFHSYFSFLVDEQSLNEKSHTKGTQLKY